MGKVGEVAFNMVEVVPAFELFTAKALPLPEDDNERLTSDEPVRVISGLLAVFDTELDELEEAEELWTLVGAGREVTAMEELTEAVVSLMMLLRLVDLLPVAEAAKLDWLARR